MRHFIIVLLALCTTVVLSGYCQVGKSAALDYPINPNGARIEDGWYKATVEYHNLNTLTKSTYTLDVEVNHVKVSRIDFGNGGSVHDGVNNSGYFYSGGLLHLFVDREGNAIKSETTVTITGPGSKLIKYKVTIE